MGIYIKGMEMPDMCAECQFLSGLICPDDIYVCDCPADGMHEKNVTKAVEEDRRDSDCPLVDMPDDKPVEVQE